jgi:hypothetical protein
MPDPLIGWPASAPVTPAGTRRPADPPERSGAARGPEPAPEPDERQASVDVVRVDTSEGERIE